METFPKTLQGAMTLSYESLGDLLSRMAEFGETEGRVYVLLAAAERLRVAGQNDRVMSRMGVERSQENYYRQRPG
jgi:hypothetical protein